MDPAARNPHPHGEGATMSDSATEAVLYVCAERGTQTPALAEERALQEGRAFAGERDLRLGEEITDHFGEVDPGKRPGWQRVRGMVARGEVTTVIVRWPNAISTDQELRYAEIAWCQEHGVRVQFSWAPLSELGGQGR